MHSVIYNEYGIDRNNTLDNEHSASQTLISKAVPESLLIQWVRMVVELRAESDLLFLNNLLVI